MFDRVFGFSRNSRDNNKDEAMLKQLVLASHNPKKLLELQAMMQSLGIELASLADYPGAVAPDEDGDTFEENAAIKARAAFVLTGLPSLADDSGLLVDSLKGEPGVHSARYAGPDADDKANNRLLLERMSGLTGAGRRARFVSVVALAFDEREVVFFHGETTGVILTQPRGSGGFGYDPLFLSDDLGVTFAEASASEKNRISHRGRALAQLRAYLEKRGGR